MGMACRANGWRMFVLPGSQEQIAFEKSVKPDTATPSYVPTASCVGGRASGAAVQRLTTVGYAGLACVRQNRSRASLTKSAKRRQRQKLARGEKFTVGLQPVRQTPDIAGLV